MANIFDNYGSDYAESCNNALRTATPAGTRDTVIPEGKYQLITRMPKISPSRKYEDELQMALPLEVVSGEYKGATVWKYYALIPETMDRLKTDMNILNIDLKNDIRNLGEASTLAAICDNIVDAAVKHRKREDGNGVYQNVYLNRLVRRMTEPEEVAEDDNPFVFD